MFSKLKSGWLILLFASLAVLVAPLIVRAQTSSPRIFLGWQAITYVPADYQGKILPVAGSRVMASVVVVENGKMVDLSTHTVFWYLNDDLVDSGLGLQKIELQMPQTSGVFEDLRVEFNDFPGGVLLKTVSIPLVSPQVVIEAPFPNRSFKPSEVSVFARPYYFTSLANNLSYAWTVNGNPASGVEHPEKLTIQVLPGTESGFRLSTEVLVTNSNRKSQVGGNSKALIYNP